MLCKRFPDSESFNCNSGLRGIAEIKHPWMDGGNITVCIRAPRSFSVRLFAFEIKTAFNSAIYAAGAKTDGLTSNREILWETKMDNLKYRYLYNSMIRTEIFFLIFSFCIRKTLLR